MKIPKLSLHSGDLLDCLMWAFPKSGGPILNSNMLRSLLQGPQIFGNCNVSLASHLENLLRSLASLPGTPCGSSQMEVRMTFPWALRTKLPGGPRVLGSKKYVKAWPSVPCLASWAILWHSFVVQGSHGAVSRGQLWLHFASRKIIRAKSAEPQSLRESRAAEAFGFLLFL